MISKELIERGGSKLEITRALLEGRADIPIPNSIWKYCGQSLNSVRSDFEALRKPVIARGSHKNDYHGLVDVVPTKRDIYTFSELENFINDSEEFMKDNDIKVHCEDWSQPYNPEIHFLIQEQGSPIVGSMIRHPHNRKELRIQYFDINNKGLWVSVSFAEVHESSILHISNEKISDEEIKEVIGVYEKLENSGIVDVSFSQQMEFGLRPMMFYQARPFKRFQPATDFEIPVPDELRVPHIKAYDYFGITPKEGIDLKFVAIGRENMGGYSWGPKANYKTVKEGSVLDVEKDGWSEGTPLYNLQDYGLILTNVLKESVPVRKKLGNIVAFCSPSHHFNYLFHENYRFMKKADFSFVCFNYNFTRSDRSLRKEDFEVFRESKLFCNGKQGIIIPERYL